MTVLIVESSRQLGVLWQRHLERASMRTILVSDAEAATSLIQSEPIDVIILDLVLENGNALTVADFASFRQPECRVIFVTNTTFFSDGSIFQLCANACAFVPSATQPDDLTAIVQHYALRD
ncbi:response regulator [Puniceibacterium sediminis]|uniref:Response regulator receiver domain-containing protein n=1 Tax=Puniceibacterium sediminis TaxID=1608407 RepID=A0A238Z758_9RHOB|nr:response regulator [Puniceibacterium sediminis]SNR78869.1 Response regulator receiver domain-containing protein [Puniceibacterium sediminis]